MSSGDQVDDGIVAAAAAAKTYEVELPEWLGGSVVEIDSQLADLLLLGLFTFVLFFLTDPFRIIEKVDERLVRLYKAPEKSAVQGRKVFCIVNPTSGNKNGKWQYAKVAFPLLRSAGATVDMVMTKSTEHVTELGESMGKAYKDGDKDAFPDGGVLVMGGDGTFFEVINGIISGLTGGSMDLDKDGARKVLETLRIAHIPVGTSNGIARTTECATAYEAISQLIAGDGEGNNTSHLDLAAVDLEFAEGSKEQTSTKRRIYDVMCTSVGFVCDYNDLTEYRWRFLGKTLKETLALLTLFALRRVVKARLLVRPCELSKEQRLELATKHGYNDTAELSEAAGHPGWLEIPGPFVLITWTTLSWIANDSCFAPETGFGDGQATVVAMNANNSRWQMMRAAMAFEKGDAGKLPLVQMYRVREMKILPSTPLPVDTTGSIVKNVKSINVKILPKAVQYLRNPSLPVT
ncbi:Sphingosine kinase 1 [Hondaea fermentalgiana]|uniref:Sphingosine kinase 1 n=1 Tax=Hondaea fermentalgiana TaxID=2315210 RepID=A0A2R5G3B5_9STRA|nr:Sphingosine kinase 1 [Hondaea fermentalgiana]|eukprot:GBG25502.1 Sphingosine kinase 1 [Hondaea fermentalgiana]